MEPELRMAILMVRPDHVEFEDLGINSSTTRSACATLGRSSHILSDLSIQV